MIVTGSNVLAPRPLWLPAIAMMLLSSTVTFAEPIPLPQVDYIATTRNEGQPDPLMTVRHHAGVMRLEFKAGARIFPILINFAEQTATILVEDKKLAGEAPPGAFPVPKPGVDNGATRVGSDEVAGEQCDIWKFTEPKSQLESEVCITPDGVWMRQSRPSEKTARYEVLTLQRIPQDPALFQVPSDYKVLPFNQLPLN